MSSPNRNFRRLNPRVVSEEQVQANRLRIIARIESGEWYADPEALEMLRVEAGLPARAPQVENPEVIEISSDSEEEGDEEEMENVPEVEPEVEVVGEIVVEDIQQDGQAPEGSATSVCTEVGPQDVEVDQPMPRNEAVEQLMRLESMSLQQIRIRQYEEIMRKKEEEKKKKRLDKMIRDCHFGWSPWKDDDEAGPSSGPGRRVFP